MGHFYHPLRAPALRNYRESLRILRSAQAASSERSSFSNSSALIGLLVTRR